MNDTTAPATEGYDSPPPSATYHSLRLDELQSEDAVLHVVGSMIWPLAQDDPLLGRIVADLEDARTIRAGAKLAIEGELQI